MTSVSCWLLDLYLGEQTEEDNDEELLDKNEKDDSEGDVSNIAEEMVEVCDISDRPRTLEVVVTKVLVAWRIMKVVCSRK